MLYNNLYINFGVHFGGYRYSSVGEAVQMQHSLLEHSTLGCNTNVLQHHTNLYLLNLIVYSPDCNQISEHSSLYMLAILSLVRRYQGDWESAHSSSYRYQHLEIYLAESSSDNHALRAFDLPIHTDPDRCTMLSLKSH